MKMYVIAFSASRASCQWNSMESGVGAATAFANSHDEAVGIGHKTARHQFPDSDGWGQWSVAVGAVSDETIEIASTLVGGSE